MQLFIPGTLHPSEDVIEMYLLGHLSPNELIIVITHCSECKSCYDVARETREYVRSMRNAAEVLFLEGSDSEQG